MTAFLEVPPVELRVPFSDLSLQWRAIEKTVMPNLQELFAKGAFCLGPWVERFESDIAAFLEVRYAVGVNSGTSALHLALLAAGIRPGDQVLVPANTFVATASAVVYAGAEPVFCDVDPTSWTINITDAERKLTPRVKAILPVHIYGQPADMIEVTRFAQRADLVVIEDAAQAIGARYRGRPVGGHGLLGCFSFYPGKNLGAAGEGGLVTTDNPSMAERVRALRNHGQKERYIHSELGFNYRMEGIQALVVSHKLPWLARWTDERRRIAERYLSALDGLPLVLPRVVHDDHVWHLFVVHSPDRDRLRRHLGVRGIETGLHYPIPLHRQPCFAGMTMDRDSFPVADRNARECLSLPIYSGMTDLQVDWVGEEIRSFFDAN